MTVCPFLNRLLSYCVISLVIMHILLWIVVTMLLYAIISSIVLCYYLVITPYIRSNKSLSFSLGRLLSYTHQACKYLSISPISHKNSYLKIAIQH